MNRLRSFPYLAVIGIALLLVFYGVKWMAG